MHSGPSIGGEKGERVRSARANTPLQASVIGAWGKLVEDPDSQTLTNWLDHGAPLGYTQPIPTNGIFPVVDGEGWREENLKNLSRSLAGWVNYESAIEEVRHAGRPRRRLREEGFLPPVCL